MVQIQCPKSQAKPSIKPHMTSIKRSWKHFVTEHDINIFLLIHATIVEKCG